MKQRRITEVVGAMSLLAMFSAPVLATETFKAPLKGFQEVPAISSTGKGQCWVESNEVVTARLSYSGLEGAVTQAHIHFGQWGVIGGVVLFLCTNVGGPTGTPSCPQSGEVTRTLTAADVYTGFGSAVAQGIAAGELDEFIKALRKGVAYCNVHTDTHPVGEIRGQLIRSLK